jgi:malate dehydrogenase
LDLSTFLINIDKLSQLDGVEKILPLGEITAEEQKLLDACLPDLKKNIEKGQAFVKNSP